MPILTHSQSYNTDADRLFALLRQPARMVALAPPDFGLSLIEGPDQPEVGQTYTVAARRWGLSTRIVSEICECIVPERWVERQIRGPMSHWQRTVELHPSAGGVEYIETIDFAPPSGMLGLTLTPARIEEDIRRGWEHRHQQLLICFSYNS
jgi:hypothetical protein